MSCHQSSQTQHAYRNDPNNDNDPNSDIRVILKYLARQAAQRAPRDREPDGCDIHYHRRYYG